MASIPEARFETDVKDKSGVVHKVITKPVFRVPPADFQGFLSLDHFRGYETWDGETKIAECQRAEDARPMHDRACATIEASGVKPDGKDDDDDDSDKTVVHIKSKTE